MLEFITSELIKKIQVLTGMRVAQGDEQRLSTWITNRSKDLGMRDPSEYISYLCGAADTSAEQQLLSQLLSTGETFFMRDSGQMALLSRVILPEIIARKKSTKKISLWAPACSTGEEVYSLLILLEPLIPLIEDWTIDVIGSDINPDFIERAKKAVYQDWSFRGCSQQFKNRYFIQTGKQWKLIDQIRNRARFLVLDLVNGSFPNPTQGLAEIDLILCRNVFNTLAISNITDKFASCLSRDGVLMTAHGELHAYRQSGLQIKIYPESIVYQKSDFTQTISHDHMQLDRQQKGIATNTSRPISIAMQSHEHERSQADQTSIEQMDRAWYLADRGQSEAALEIAKKVILQDPMQPEAYYLQAVISLEMDQILEAKNNLRKALYIDPDFVPAYLELITLKIQEGNTNIAASLCQQAMKSLEKSSGQNSTIRFNNNTVSDINSYLNNLSKSLTSQHD